MKYGAIAKKSTIASGVKRYLILPYFDLYSGSELQVINLNRYSIVKITTETNPNISKN